MAKGSRMRRTWPVLLPAIVLAVAGAGISYMLMAKHLTKKTGVAWFDNVCDGGAESAVSCDQVLASPYGMFPPVPADLDPEFAHEPRRAFGSVTMRPRPVAMYGVMYFMALAGWYLFVGRPSHSRRILHLLPLLLNTAGAVGSACFAYIMFFTDLEFWCPWCLVTHAINALLLGCTILLWPRRPAPLAATAPAREPARPEVPSSALVLDDETGPPFEETSVLVAGKTADLPPLPRSTATTTTPAPLVTAPPPHPSFRLVATTLVAILAGVSAELWFHDYAALTGRYADLNRAIEAVRGDAASLYAMYESGEKFDIPVRDDDPVRNAGPVRVALVMFSDFECAHCAQFEKYLAEKITPLFDGYLKVVFKHFPANKACNHRVKDVHPHACQAAQAAEAARALGGNDAFWMAHELLFASGRKLADYDYRGLARQLNLDPEVFVETLDSPAVQKRIQEDIKLGLDLGVDATPGLYLSGRRVPRLATNTVVFWQAAKARMDAVLRAKGIGEQPAAEQQIAGPPAPQPS